MKKFLKCLIGFPIGALMLFISYILVYLIDGETTYIIELSKLSNVGFLIDQVFNSGLVFVVLMIMNLYYEKWINKKYPTIKEVLIEFLKVSVVFLVYGCVGLLFNQITSKCFNISKTMSGEVGQTVVGIGIIYLIIYAVGYVIYQSYEEFKINKALKEKNKTEEN